MKKHVVLLAATALLCYELNAQEGRRFYVKADAGYAMGLVNNMVLAEKSTDPSNGSTKAIIGTYGQGLKASLGLGYMFGPHLGVELGGIYSAGATIKASSYAIFASPGGMMGTQNSETHNNTALVYLQAKMALNPIGKWTPYGRLGIAASVYAKTYEHETITIAAFNDNRDTKTEVNYRMSLGATAAMGCSYQLNERLSLYGELNTLILNLNRKKSTITASTLNGVDRMPTLRTYEKETEYHKSIHTTSPGDLNSPSQSISVFDPLSYVGISLGIQIAI